MKTSGSRTEGDDYIVEYADIDFALVFSRVRETDASIRALVTPQVLSKRGATMAPIMVNLFTLADRERLARAIAEQVYGEAGVAKGSPHLADWKDGIERAFSEVLKLHTTPEPLTDLGTYEAPADAGHLIWPLLARNEVNVFLADQGAGKSYAGLFLAAVVAGGLGDGLLPEPWRRMGSGPVIYFDAETNKATQRRRLERVCAALSLKELPHIMYRTLRPPLANYGSLIRGYVAEVGAVFAVFDSLTFLAGGDLNTTETSVPTMNVIGEAGEHCTKLAIAHHGKAGRENGARPSALGSSAFEFKARSIWLIRKVNEEESDHIDQVWTQTKGSDERLHRGFGLRLTFNASNTEARFAELAAADSAAVATRTGSVVDKIRAALMDMDDYRADTNAIAQATRLLPQEITRAARNMADVTRIGTGKGRGNMFVFQLRQNGTGDAPRENEQTNTPLSNPLSVRYPCDQGITNKRTNEHGDNEHVRYAAEGEALGF